MRTNVIMTIAKDVGRYIDALTDGSFGRVKSTVYLRLSAVTSTRSPMVLLAG
jgi:hypothetical protein